MPGTAETTVVTNNDDGTPAWIKPKWDGAGTAAGTNSDKRTTRIEDAETAMNMQPCPPLFQPIEERGKEVERLQRRTCRLEGGCRSTQKEVGERRRLTYQIWTSSRRSKPPKHRVPPALLQTPRVVILLQECMLLNPLCLVLQHIMLFSLWISITSSVLKEKKRVHFIPYVFNVTVSI
ncbi:uncharacterized protein BP01DRAFT_54084 [Aspergillus saccharolyticus JOP 1030-1]|uniref:Uncharacterized protein n=1 Tax=Aspergillus saccharolyticus JOP 1030-1 TaxID=1450539 RepID=A0A318ZMJ5_9EURO|nr:hypothetical protein BP01DRAFT_54084 [Aspergillus saccharolyticus JOP 1030-1]PYH45110.1 hypothetical protein BP01DRAFT_54084 [Aspergillus saccharolyticus JOP 1030-1]